MSATGISEAARTRTDDIVSVLGASTSLDGSSRLPGWTRLTVACHLRYGAVASRRMTAEALAGTETSFYPGGRSVERAGTLEPGRAEDPRKVVASLGEESTRLHDSWARLSEAEWNTSVREPADNTDLGDTTLVLLAIMRLTEIEVHGSDLDIGLDDWSEVFVSSALPVRISRLATRRSNHRAIDSRVQGSWKLAATDGPSWKVSVYGDQVTSELVDPDAPADAVIEATSRDMLAMLLGRPLERRLVTHGDERLVSLFPRAFPGP